LTCKLCFAHSQQCGWQQSKEYQVTGFWQVRGKVGSLVRHHDTQRKEIQRKDIQPNDTQPNDTRHIKK